MLYSAKTLLRVMKMTIIHDVTKIISSEYYGDVTYRLIAVVDFHCIMEKAILEGIVDDLYQEYGATFHIPDSIKESLKYRDKIAFSMQYVKGFRQCFSAMSFYGNDFAYLLYAALDEDNLNWENKNHGYFMAGGKCKKLPITTTRKQIYKFVERHNDYFPEICFTDENIAKKYVDDYLVNIVK